MYLKVSKDSPFRAFNLAVTKSSVFILFQASCLVSGGFLFSLDVRQLLHAESHLSNTCRADSRASPVIFEPASNASS
jgi:hypothetical protein